MALKSKKSKATLAKAPKPNQLVHKIKLVVPPGSAVDRLLWQACGVARFTWNWALAAWNEEYAKTKSTADIFLLKKHYNKTKAVQYPWTLEVPKDAHQQPFDHLNNAWRKFFKDLQAGAKIAPDDHATRRVLRSKGTKMAYRPKFKKKGKCQDSFYMSSGKFGTEVDANGNPWLRLRHADPRIRMTEHVRFTGRMVSCTIVRETDGWYACIQVNVDHVDYFKKRTANNTNAFDLGIKSKAVDATGKVLDAVRPLEKNMRRVKIRQRRADHRRYENQKAHAALRLMLLNLAAHWLEEYPTFGHMLLWMASNSHRSKNLEKSFAALARLHRKIANTRKDASHKLTTMICRKNQTVVIEDLNVRGMLSNPRLSRAISDVGFGMFRQQMEYKAKRYGVALIIADRWFPSSKQCSVCHVKNIHLTLSQRKWQCAYCGTFHERDWNAAVNLRNLALGWYPMTTVNLAVQEVSHGPRSLAVARRARTAKMVLTAAHALSFETALSSHSEEVLSRRDKRLATRTALPMATLTCKGKAPKTLKGLGCGKVTLVNELPLPLVGMERAPGGGAGDGVPGSGQEAKVHVCSPEA